MWCNDGRGRPRPISRAFRFCRNSVPGTRANARAAGIVRIIRRMRRKRLFSKNVHATGDPTFTTGGNEFVLQPRPLGLASGPLTLPVLLVQSSNLGACVDAPAGRSGPRRTCV